MTSQQRSWTRQSKRARYRWAAGLVATLGSMLGLTVVAQPARAVNPMADLSIVAPPSFNQGDTHNVVAKLNNMSTGLNDSIAVSLTISNATEVATNDFAVTKVTVNSAYCPSLTDDGFTCTFPYDGSPNVAVTFTIKNNTDNVPSGSSTTFDKSLIAVNDLTFVTVTNSLSQYFNLTLLGPPRDTTISGKVDDATTGGSVPGALVNLHDSAHPAHSYSAHTDSRGGFSFPVDAKHPVAAGKVYASVTKSGYKTHIGQPVNFTPGTTISNWKLLVTPVATVPTPSPSQPASADPSAAPSGAQASAISGGPGGSYPASGAATVLASDSGSGPDLFKYALIGGLILVLAAIAAMVIMLSRRRRRVDDGDDYQPTMVDYPTYAGNPGYPPAGGGYTHGGPPGNPRSPYPDQGGQHGYGEPGYPAYPASGPRA